jgi:hypothetical protein
LTTIKNLPINIKPLFLNYCTIVFNERCNSAGRSAALYCLPTQPGVLE